MSTKEKTTVIIPVCRITWPYLNKKDEGRKTSTGKFGVTFYVAKGKTWDVDCKPLRMAVLKVGREYLKNPTLKLSDFNNPFADTDEIGDETLPGCFRFSARNGFKPGVSTPQGKPMTEEEIARIKGGDYCRALLTVFPYEYMKKKGVSLSLDVLQFSHAGDAIGGGSHAAGIKLLGELDVEMEDMETDETVEEDEEETEEVVVKTKANGKTKPAKVVAAKKGNILHEADGDDLLV